MSDTRQLVTLRVDRDLHERIKAAADLEGRSVNNFVNYVLEHVVPHEDTDSRVSNLFLRPAGLEPPLKSPGEAS